MAQHGNNGGGGGLDMDDPMVVGFIIMGIFIAWLIFWSAFIEQISIAHIYYRYISSYPVYYISSHFADTPILSYPYNFIQKWCAPEPGIFGKCTVDFSKITKEDNYAIAKPYNIFFLLVLCVALVRIFLKVEKKHPESKFSKFHNLDSFTKEQEANYGHLKLINKIDFIEKSIHDPLYGMALNTKQFAFRYQLVKDWGPDANGTDFLPYIDRAKAEKIFQSQLGKAFSGWSSLSTSQKMLLSIIMPRCAANENGTKDEAFDTAVAESQAMMAAAWQQFKFGQCGLSEEEVKNLPDDKLDDLWLTDPEVDVALFETNIHKYADSVEVKRILYNHAYVTTIIYEMVLQARRLGVLPPAELRWLRFYDRPLWYLINSIGRRAPFAEAAGVHCHYLAEKKAGESYVQPMVMPAVNALSEQLQKYKYTEPSLFNSHVMPESWSDLDESDLERLYPKLPII